MENKFSDKELNVYKRIQNIEDDINSLYYEKAGLINEIGLFTLYQIWFTEYKKKFEDFIKQYPVFSNYTLKYNSKYSAYICHIDFDENIVTDEQWNALMKIEDTVKYDYVLFETNCVLYK